MYGTFSNVMVQALRIYPIFCHIIQFKVFILLLVFKLSIFCHKRKFVSNLLKDTQFRPHIKIEFAVASGKTFVCFYNYITDVYVYSIKILIQNFIFC